MLNIDIPADWERSVKKILLNNWRKILVLGAVDRGKSTYCKFLSHRLMEAGFKVAIVDADVGQKDIGPPATITLGYPELFQELAIIKPASLYFVGTTSPVGHLLPMVVGTRRIVDSSRAFFTIINTTGLIHGVGRILKSYKIELIRPHAIVAIEENNELKSILRAYRNHRVIQITPSSMAASKTIQERTAAREKAFHNYFAQAAEISLDLKKIIFQRSILFTGKALENSQFLYSERTSEGIVGISERPHELRHGLKIIAPGFEKNLLCGAADWSNTGLGLAIIKEIEYTSNTISLITPVPAERIKIIQLGDLYLSSDGRELGKKIPRNF
jgi:polynucleotide 5'-hydroxyl-kinase GRC3/NOL9